LNDILWDRPLYYRTGAERRMHGITVIHDFIWREVFPDERTQFKGCECLARLIIGHCPPNKKPAVLLTTKENVNQATIENDQYYLPVVHISKYLHGGYGDTAITYFGKLMAPGVISAANFDWGKLSDPEFQVLLDNKLDLEFLKHWVKTDPGRVEKLITIISEMNVPENTLTDDKEKEISISLLKRMGDNMWNVIEQAGLELPSILANRRVWMDRKKQVEDFRIHLEAGDWLERRWQDFFVENKWIFGFGLSYKFLHLIESRPDFGGSNVSGRGGVEGDFLLASQAETQFTVLVEIKRPDSELVQDELYRNQVHRLGQDLVAGVSQLQRQCLRWAEESEKSENKDLLESSGIFTHEPKGILVIGNSGTFKENRPKRRVFESFRRNLHNPEIITFDELLSRAENVAREFASESTMSN
jgi:hypothetical protein